MLSAGLVLAPRLIDPEPQLRLFINLPGDLQHADHEAEPGLFTERARPAGVESAGDLPQPDTADITGDGRLDEIADKALQIENVVFPPREPLRQSPRAEVDQRAAPENQP